MTTVVDARTPLACRLAGCRWRYRAEGEVLRGSCRRCGSSGMRRFRRKEDAARLAAYLGRGEPGTFERAWMTLARRSDRPS